MTQRATLAAGCFWGVEETFRTTPGVTSTAVGYTGGGTDEPSYETVCSGRTGHAEAVFVEFNPSLVSYGQLLDIFWGLHDPTTPNRQGPDIGTQYRSAIYVHDAAQEAAARDSKAALEQSGRHRDAVVTEILPAVTFWRAEEYHQQYFHKRGDG